MPEKLMEFVLSSSTIAKDSAFCLFHQQDCKMPRSNLHVAGIICVSWSPFGLSSREQGRDFVMYCAWVAERRRQKDRCYHLVRSKKTHNTRESHESSCKQLYHHRTKKPHQRKHSSLQQHHHKGLHFLTIDNYISLLTNINDTQPVMNMRTAIYLTSLTGDGGPMGMQQPI